MSQTSNGGGIGFFGILTIVFTTLKLTGYIAWSWWWITAPMWGPLVLVCGGFLIWVSVAEIRTAIRNKRQRRRLP